MKIIELQFYRNKREIELLEKKFAELVQRSSSAREMKMCFREWLTRTSGR